MGAPGKVVREVTPEQIEHLAFSARHYVENWKRYAGELVER
jgi:carbonic anhydrase/acetyltransferase-like protein (isoleucine patch superfamily)